MAAPVPRSDFLFVTCQPGAEPALKAEVAGTADGLRFAYSRPGLVTFRAPAPLAADVPLASVFARAWGISLGPAASVGAAVQAAGALGGPLRLHAFDREPDGDRAAGVDAALRAAAGDLFRVGVRARPGQLVLDVIVPPPPAGTDGLEEPAWLGAHVHGSDRSPWPGGRAPIEVPFAAPSRAYRKLEEALDWSRAPVRAGDTAVEIGSAPGGASYALLGRGLEVVGVDPGEMAPIVLQFVGRSGNRFRHLRTAVGALRPEALPDRVHWLLLDVNLAPQVALHNVRRLVAALRRDLVGVLFTLKLNDWSMAAEIPALLDRVRAMGLTGVRATQLPTNRQEICVYAETQKGAERRRRR